MKTNYTIKNFAKRLIMVLAVGLITVNVWGKVTVPSGWTQVTSLSEISASDKILIVVNDTSMYLNGSVNSSGHFSATALSASAPASASAAGVILLESTGTSNRYKLKLVSTNKYITALDDASGNASVSASSDSYGWQFEGSSGTFDARYQETNKQAYLRSYSNSTFRTYGNKSGASFRIFRYESCAYSMTISKGTGTNCTFTLGTSGSGLASCSGVSTTVTITPNTGYGKSPSVTQSGASAAPTISGSGNNWTVSYGNNTTGTSTINVSCSANDYTVTLDDDGGSGGSGSKTVTYNANTNLTTSVAVPTKAHHDFGGYYTAKDGGGTQLINADGSWKASVSTYTDGSKNWIKASGVTLYAKWTEHDLKNYRTICCTPLGEIDGDVTLSQLATPNATKLKATWSMDSETGIDSYDLEVYDSSDNLVKTINDYTSGDDITGLDPCTTYYVALYTVSDGDPYCDGGLIGISDEVTTIGYTYTVNATNCQLTSTSDPVPDDMCEGDVLVYYEATGGSTLPDDITVTNVSDKGTGWWWDSSTGELGIDADYVTGDVEVTIFASCPGFSFHYGNDGDDASLWTIACFGDAVSNVRTIEDFQIPSSTHFYVGYQGKYTSGSSSDTDKPNSSTLTWSSLYFDASIGDGSRPMVGQATGATGTVKIIDNSNWTNKKASFIPDGYKLKFGSSTYSDFAQYNGHEYRSGLVEYSSSTADDNVSVGIINANDDDSYVATANSVAMRHLFLRVDANWASYGAKFSIYSIDGSDFKSGFMVRVPGETDLYEGWVAADCDEIIFVRHNGSAGNPSWDEGNKWNQTGDLTLSTGKNLFTIDTSSDWNGQTEGWSTYEQKGQFRMNEDWTDKNWYVRFVPSYVLSFDANGGEGAPDAQYVSVDADPCQITVTTSEPTRTGYTFLGWNESSSAASKDDDWDGGDTHDMDGDVTLYAVWSANTISLTLDKNNSDASGSSSGSGSIKYDATTKTSITAATRTGYNVEGYYSENTCTAANKVLTASGDVVNSTVSGYTTSGKWTRTTTPTTLYTKWTAKTTTVSFNQNSGTGGQTTTKTATYASAMPTPITLPTREGHTFGGYYESAGGTGAQYYTNTGASAKNWDKEDATWTLYAKWTVNNYTLTWSWNGGSTSSTTHTAAGSVAYGTTLVYPANNTMSKTGHTFTGWSSTPSTMPAANTTITAQWSVNNYNVAVLANSNVAITATPSGSSAIAESGNANVNYGTTVTLNCSSITSGMTWGGWKVYKADAPGTTVTVSGTGNGATFTMPAYAVKVEAFIYSAGIAWCDPEIEVTGDVHLTSYKNIPVNSTSGADNLIEISSSDFGSATRLDVAYLDADAADAEVDPAESVFLLCNDGSVNYDPIDGFDLDYEWGTTHSIKYTPNAYDKRDNYKLQFILKRGDKVLKTVTHNIYGRALPEEFVIASKYLGHWYALPNTMGTATETVTPIQITVDNATTPTEASYAPSTTVYKGAARKTATSNRNSIRLTNDGSHWLITNNSNAQLGLSATQTEGYENREVWYLKSSTFGAYELAMDPAQSPTKKLGMYNGNMGMYADPAYTSEDIYLLPIDTKYTPIEATATDWMKDIIGVTASTTANKLGIAKENGTEYAAVTLASEETSHVADFDGDIDFTGLTGEKLLLKWYDGSTLVGGSQVTVPSIVLAGSNDDWSDFASAPTLADYVVLSKPMEINVVGAKAKRIEIDQSGSNTGSIEIPAGKELIVAETVRKFNGSSFGATAESDIVISSDDSDGLGGLVMGDHDGTNKATVYFATLSHGTSGSTASVSQYVGTPFCDESTISYDWYNSWVYGITYDGSGNIGWTRINGEPGMTPFKGYAVISADPAGHVYEMGGSLNPTANRTMDGLNWQSGTGTNPNNENLLANGWMAPIKIKAFKAEDFVKTDASIYIFNSGSPDDYDAIGASYGSGAGQYQTYSIGTAEATDVIPAMQSFSVYTNASGGSSVTLDYKRLVYDPAVAGTTPVPNRAPLATKNADEANKLKLFVKAESGYGDMLYMWEREDFTDYFENGWDARKVFGETTAPQLYAVTPDGKMAVNCVPTFEGVVMGFKAGDNENFYTFTFECDDEAEALYLVDTDNNAYTRVLSTNSYWFTTSDKEAHNRFILTHNAPGSTTGIDNTGSVQSTKAYKVIMHDKMYIIYGDEMYDATGKRVNEIK